MVTRVIESVNYVRDKEKGEKDQREGTGHRKRDQS